MRATTFGLMAASLAFLLPTNAGAGLSSHSGGFDVFSFAHHGRGDQHRRFTYDLGVYAPSIIDLLPSAADDPADGAYLPVILAPYYVPAAPAKKPVRSGPRIIVIGSQPTGRLPVVIYGGSPVNLSN